VLDFERVPTTFTPEIVALVVSHVAVVSSGADKVVVRLGVRLVLIRVVRRAITDKGHSYAIGGWSKSCSGRHAPGMVPIVDTRSILTADHQS
jgi:hypothetical protein